MPDPTYTTEIEFVSGSYTNITSHCHKIQISTTLARGSEDNISVPTCSLLIDNHNRQFSKMNSESPYYPHLQVGKNIRVTALYVGSTYNLFSGIIDSYSLDPKHGADTAYIQTSGKIKEFQRRIINLPVFANTKPNSLFTDILSASLVSSYSIDTLYDDITYAWYNDTPPLSAISEILGFGDYYFYSGGGGDVRIKDRHWIAGASAVASYYEFYDYGYTYSENSIINQCKIEGTPRKLSSSVNTITFLDVSNTHVYLPGSSAMGFTLTYLDPNTQEQPTPALNMISPVASVDYSFTTIPSGGSYLHSTTSLFTTFYATTVVCTVSNNYGDTLYINHLQFRGYSLQKQPMISAPYDNSSSQSVYGKRLYTLTNDLINSTLMAQDYAYHIVREGQEPHIMLNVALKNQWPDCLARDLGDIINIVNSQTAVSGKYYIKTIDHTIDTTRGLEHISEYEIEEWIDRGYVVLDHATYGLMDSGRIWGF